MRSILPSISCIALALTLTGATSDCTWNKISSVGMTVGTTSGDIVGHKDSSYPVISEYLGIPFAKPPVGDLRFAAPVPFQGTEKLVADKQPLSCPQTPSVVNTSQPLDFQHISINGASYANQYSEDCLYLNLWTKFPAKGAQLKPVLVWFYGGGVSKLSWTSKSIFTDSVSFILEAQAMIQSKVAYLLHKRTSS